MGLRRWFFPFLTLKSIDLPLKKYNWAYRMCVVVTLARACFTLFYQYPSRLIFVTSRLLILSIELSFYTRVESVFSDSIVVLCAVYLISEVRCNVVGRQVVVVQRQSNVAFVVEDEVRHCVGNQHVASDVELPLVQQQRFVNVPRIC